MASILDIASSQSMADSLNEGHPLECTICLERMKEISFLTTQPDSNGNVCNHCFCTACIQRIVSRAEDPKCPVCRRSVLAVNRSRVANELLHELDNEREQRKKALYDKEELIGEVKELVEERDKLSQEISQLRKAHADELAKESAKVKSQIEKFRKACEIQLEEERKDKDITIKTLQQQLKEATLASDQWKKKFDKEKTLGDSKRVEDLMRENTKLNAELEIRSKELDASSSTLLERTKALKAKTKECEEMLEKLEEKSNEVEAKNYQLELKAKEYEHLRGLFEIKLRELQGKDQEISYKEEQVVRLQEQIELLKNQSEAYTMQLEMKKREILDIKNEMQKLSSEVEKWQSLYRRALEEMQSKKPELVENQDTSPSKNSVLASWLTPSLTKQLSSFWTKTGPLVKSATKIEFQERRGSSRNSEVWRALTANGSSKGVALKRISQPESHEGFREAMILHKVDHINILKLNGVLRGVQIPGKNVIGDLMILPYVQYDLEYVLGQNPFKLKINQVRFILYQTLSALVYLHSGEVVHRDIKPTSILLDENYNVKLGSFGQARSTLSQPFNPLYLPINRYSTPEACHLRETTRTSVVWKAGDIWSLGCVFFEMLKGSPLFDAKDKTQLLSQIFSVTECKASNTDLMKYALLNVIEPSKRESSIVDSLRSSSLVDVSLESLDLLKFMLAFEPTKRIQASEALKHRFFTENKLSEVHRTCPLQSELTDANLPPFTDLCGGL